MKELIHYRVEITDGGKYGCKKNEFTKRKVQIIGENDINIVINDFHFTTLKKEKCKYSMSVDDEVISIRSNDSFFGNAINYNLYTERKVRASTIKKHINAKIADQFGFFFRGVDLEFIKD